MRFGGPGEAKDGATLHTGHDRARRLAAYGADGGMDA